MTDALDPLPSYQVRVYRLDPTCAELHIELGVWIRHVKHFADASCRVATVLKHLR